jgi:LPXTG-motif cell wall-anchored protein
MPSFRLRLGAAAAVVALGGILFTAGAAQAADGATITVESDPADEGVVFSEDPLMASGTCPVRTDSSATVTVKQGSDVVATDAVDVAADGTWSAELDISDAGDGDATVTVDCFAYADQRPTGSASTDIYVITFDSPIIDVTVSPSKVRLGEQLTITGQCPAGTEVAVVAAGTEDADEPFLAETVTPAADGTVRYTGTVPRTGVEPGKAAAFVLCGVGSLDVLDGSNTDEFPTAFGFAEFTVLPAAVAPGTATPPPASTTPVLANTGSDNGPMAALAAGLLLLGAAAHVARRRVTR